MERVGPYRSDAYATPRAYGPGGRRPRTCAPRPRLRPPTDAASVDAPVLVLVRPRRVSRARRGRGRPSDPRRCGDRARGPGRVELVQLTQDRAEVASRRAIL